jgi:DNA-binding NtrC family response regulator
MDDDYRATSRLEPDTNSLAHLGGGRVRRGATSWTVRILDQWTARRIILQGQATAVVGRGIDAEIRLADGSVSREHARLVLRDGRLTLFDLGSTNGVAVNGRRVVREQELDPGDVLSVGRSTLIVDELAAAPARVASPPAIENGRIALSDRIVLVEDEASVLLFEQLRRAAASELSVLIHGETGVGKEGTARFVHEASPRRDGPFVALNCAILPESLAESELFGHERGAFSGAVSARSGLLESVRGGTLFLDEVGELSAASQARLLRVLETKTVRRLGEVRERSIDLRVVSASNRDLLEEIERGRFRRDLYFRLSAVRAHVAPLRERPRELVALMRHHLEEACGRAGRAAPQLSDEAIAALRAHDWPGNVRELKHVAELIAVSLDGAATVWPEHLDLGGGRRATSTRRTEPIVRASRATVADEIRALERRRIVEALERTRGNQSRAAMAIGMPRRTFVAKLKQYGIRHEAEED